MTAYVDTSFYQLPELEAPVGSTLVSSNCVKVEEAVLGDWLVQETVWRVMTPSESETIRKGATAPRGRTSATLARRVHATSAGES